MITIHDVAFCFNCKKYFNENLTDSSGFVCCPNCKGAYKYNVMQLSYDKDNKYSIEIQDEMIISFVNKNHFKFLIRKMTKLLEMSREKRNQRRRIMTKVNKELGISEEKHDNKR